MTEPSSPDMQRTSTSTAFMAAKQAVS